MTKEEFIAEIESQKERGVNLLIQVQQMHVAKNNYGDYTAVFGTPRLYYTPKEELEPVKNEYEAWKCYIHDFLLSALEKDDDFISEWDKCLQTPYRHDISDKEWYSREIHKALSKLDSFVQRVGFRFKESVMQEETTNKVISNNNKPPKVFISHKKEDKAYADALVNLIYFILGADGDKIFCSSISGCGIGQSKDILEELKRQFDQYDVYMVIIHSPRYYQSAICLNEMGASWVLGTKFSSFLTNDCKLEHLHGVINAEKICIDLNDDVDMLNCHLNEFKDDLIAFFNANAVDQNKWENARNRFVNEVKNFVYKQSSISNVDLFDTIYLPAFDHIFDLLDLENYQSWAYQCAIGGYTILNKTIYYNLDRIVNYIKSRPKNKDYAVWDSLIQNLGLLINDFNFVFSQYAEQIDNERFCVERFYKKIDPNPNYDRDLEAYNQHVFLLSDMLFELTRLCNLILGKIRELYPAYKNEIGILHIDNRFSSPDLLYKKEEITPSPYPGLEEYIKVRLTRETHYGDNPRIGADGYER